VEKLIGKRRVKNALVASLLSFSMFSGSAFVPFAQETASAQLNKKDEKPLKIKGDRMELQGEWYFDFTANKVGFNLMWKEERSSKGYMIYRSTEKDGNYELIATVDGKFKDNFQDKTLQAGTDYFYKVRYYKNNSLSPLSEPIQTDYSKDTDGDSLPDFQELTLGTSIHKKDSDEDGLNDQYELQISLTNPVKKDSDGNGIDDGDEDLDKDGLSTLKEVQFGTEPQNADSDADEWMDGVEVKEGTDPLNEDTDEDKVVDGIEKSLGFNPLHPDTDGNGTIDGDETVEKVTEAGEFEKDEVVTPSVKIESDASQANSTTITNIDGTDAFLNGAPTIGAPYDFNTDIEFEEAEMTFTYDASKIEGDFEPAIFYYNEDEKRLEKLPNQTHDASTGKVTAIVHHFSKYVLIDELSWNKIWEREIRPPAVDDDGNIKNIDVVFSIDSSGSMDWNDPSDLRKQATKNFVDKLKEQDRAAVVDFDSYAEVVVELTTDKQRVKYAIDTIDSVGGTDLYEGVMEGIQEIAENGRDGNLKYLIFLTDGDGYWSDSAIEYAKENDVVIYTIGLGSGINQALLQRIATSTGGKYFYANEAGQLEEVLEDTAEETNKCTDDSDADGLTDCMEEDGFRMGNGQFITTDKSEPDTDGDGLLDGEEVLPQFIPHNGGYYVMISNPTEIDTDFDYKKDEDESPNDRNSYNFTQHLSVFMSSLSYKNLEGYLGEGGIDLSTTTIGSVRGVIKDLNIKQEQLKGWKIVNAEDSHWYDTGFSALALKKGNMVAFAYRGTDKLEFLGDWGLSDLAILQFNNNWQVPIADRFAANTLIDQGNADRAKVYITGHSLGGFLAQVVTHDMIENEVYEHQINGKRIDQTRDIFARSDIFGQAYTFNAAPFVNPNGLTTSLLAVFTSAIPWGRIDDEKYNSYITNYSIKGDPLSITVPLLAERLGQDPTPYFEKTIDKSAHSLAQFNTIFY
jgi:von Willebrand factor type A domain/Lipase (class 3)